MSRFRSPQAIARCAVKFIAHAAAGALLCTGIVACATGDSQSMMGSDPGTGDKLQLEAGAYGVEYFQFPKSMKRRPPNDYVFYFKHCDLLGRRPFYLQSEYGCTPPP